MLEVAKQKLEITVAKPQAPGDLAIVDTCPHQGKNLRGIGAEAVG
jgi:hypothetical protein